MSEPESPADNKPKSFSYTAHNYEAMNRAIDTEIEKRHEISSLYHYQSSSRRTLMLLHITLSLCVLTLTAAIIFWLFHQGQNIELKTPWSEPTLDQSLREQETQSALNILSAQERGAPDERAFINTSFTVFHRTLIPSGEYVVTGKTFQPDQLSMPSEQYCYLEKTQNSETLSGLPLAVVENKQLIMETEVPELIRYAKRYCQFSR